MFSKFLEFTYFLRKKTTVEQLIQATVIVNSCPLLTVSDKLIFVTMVIKIRIKISCCLLW